MRKKDELNDPNSCTNKAAEDEPLFTLRAKDQLAPTAVRRWADLAEARGVDADKVADARATAVAMEEWQASNGSKLPD